MTTTGYATLAQLKRMRNIADDQSDELLTLALGAATSAIDKITGRSFGGADASATARTYTTRGRIVTDLDGDRLLVDDIATDTGLTVGVGDGVTFTPVTDYLTGPDNAAVLGRPITSLRRDRGAWIDSQVQVAAVWGWPAVPDDIALATLLLASRLYLRRNTPEGVATSTDWGPMRLTGTDPDVQRLIAPYVLPGFA